MKFSNSKVLSLTLPLLLSLIIYSNNLCYSEDVLYELTKTYEDRYRMTGIPYRKEFKDDVVYILPARDRKHNKIAKYTDINIEARKRFEKNAEKEALETGETVSYIMDGIPDADGELEYFELPINEKISGCVYPKGYTYPENCISDDGEHIFKAGRDPQEKLDEIARSQGKTSKYNKIPTNYDPYGCSIDENGVEHPCPETTVVDLINQSSTDSTNSKTATLP